MGPNTYLLTMMACDLLGVILVYIAGLKLNEWLDDDD